MEEFDFIKDLKPKTLTAVAEAKELTEQLKAIETEIKDMKSYLEEVKDCPEYIRISISFGNSSKIALGRYFRKAEIVHTIEHKSMVDFLNAHYQALVSMRDHLVYTFNQIKIP